MNKKQSKHKKIFLIGVLAAVIVFAIVITVAMWCMQIRLEVPDNITIQETGMHTAQISWDEVEYATSYEVQVYEGAEQSLFLEEETDANAITLKGLHADSSYEISVTAFYDKKDRHKESEPAEAVSFKTASPEPGAVEGLRAEGKTQDTISVQWSACETTDMNADGTSVDIYYTLMFSNARDGNYQILAENLEETEYLHEGLKELDTCYYKVIMKERMDEKEYSGAENNSTASATTLPGTVSGLAAEGVSESEIKISWDAYPVEQVNNDGTPVTISYTLYAAESETAEFSVLADNLADTFYQEENLEPETTRYYKVSVTAQKDGNSINGSQTEPVNAVTQEEKKAADNSNGTAASGSTGGSGGGAASGNGNSDGSLTDAEKNAQARAVAQQIADGITGSTDLEKVRKAAEVVAIYCSNATYTSSDPDYRTAYGVFCKGVYTCSGATRALGMVLECMGYSWEHVNENQWTHQWCRVTMDGQAGWADGMGGIADYGESPFASGGTYTDSDGTIYFVP